MEKPKKEEGGAMFVLDRPFFNQGVNAKFAGRAEEIDSSQVLVARGPNAVALIYKLKPIRRILSGEGGKKFHLAEEFSGTLCARDGIKTGPGSPNGQDAWDGKLIVEVER